VILARLFLSFLKVGIFGFGGGYAMLPLMEEELITRAGWLTMGEFVDIIAVAEMTPGPVAINAATYVGYRVAGFWGALTSTLGVIAPSLFIMGVLTLLYLRYRKMEGVRLFFGGVRPAVAALVAFAALRVGQTLSLDTPSIVIAVACFALVTTRRVHPTAVLLLAAVAGILTS
jgi:chromate transporter